MLNPMRPMTCFALLLGMLVPGGLTVAGHGDDATSEELRVCAKQLHRRTLEQVLAAHFAAIRSTNAQLVACDYAKDAVFVMPGSVVRGREEIQATFAGFFQAFGTLNAFTVTSLTTDGPGALITYKVDSEHVVVTDGVDTFVIAHGLIVFQTAYFGGFATR